MHRYHWFVRITFLLALQGHTCFAQSSNGNCSPEELKKITPSKRLKIVKTPPPPRAIRDGISGCMQVKLVVGVDGSVTSATNFSGSSQMIFTFREFIPKLIFLPNESPIQGPWDVDLLVLAEPRIEVDPSQMPGTSARSTVNTLRFLLKSIETHHPTQ